MNTDFSINTYKSLLNTLLSMGYCLMPYIEFHNSNDIKKRICIRHDVDRLTKNSLCFAKILHQNDQRGTFYFRVKSINRDRSIIEEIYEMGHEVGYHYESFSSAKGNIQSAIADFEKNLNSLRKLVQVKTICMHGSPLSRFDSRVLWKYFDYKDYGILAEPYFDTDFSKVIYLTDTGRKWNGSNFSIRDKLNSKPYINKKKIYETDANLSHFYSSWKIQPPLNSAMNMTPIANQIQSQFNYRTTFDIIKSAQKGLLPDRIMFTFHPQRWTNQPFPWLKELIWQNSKNVVKLSLIKFREF